MLSKDDIEIFVLTCDRLRFLKESLDTLLKQTVGGIKITVLDNASLDGTREYVETLSALHPNLRYVRHSENIGGIGNMNYAVKSASATYAMMFHDDDLLHPRYMELVLRVLDRHPEVSIVASGSFTPAKFNALDWEDVSGEYCCCRTRADFAAFLYGVGRFAFPSVIYRSEFLKAARFKGEVFGKIADKPMVLDSLGAGAAAVFTDRRLLRYRVHSGQDTNKIATGPFYAEIINHNKYFKAALSAGARYRLVFALRCYKHLKSLYKMGGDKTLSLREFVARANSDGAGCALSSLCNAKLIGGLFYGACNAAKAVYMKNFFPVFK